MACFTIAEFMPKICSYMRYHECIRYSFDLDERADLITEIVRQEPLCAVYTVIDMWQEHQQREVHTAAEERQALAHDKQQAEQFFLACQQETPVTPEQVAQREEWVQQKYPIYMAWLLQRYPSVVPMLSVPEKALPEAA
jgi:hypothetical protein